MLQRLALLLVLITLASTAPLRAQSGDTAVPEIDPSLTKVLVAGYWKAGATTGSYRVVEISEGWEEIHRRVVLQWLSDPSEEEASIVVASRAMGPVAGNVWSVSDPDLVLVKGHWYLTVRTTSRSMGQPDGRLRVALGAPGKLGPVSRR